MPQFSNGIGNVREPVGAIYGIAGHQFHPLALFISEDAVSIVLLFVDPTMLVEGLRNQCGKHGSNSNWNGVLQDARVGDCRIATKPSGFARDAKPAQSSWVRLRAAPLPPDLRLPPAPRLPLHRAQFPRAAVCSKQTTELRR